jgi:predicted secreted acid phosphatase
MRKLIWLTCCSLLTLNLAYAKEPQNLDHLKSKLIKYHDSGEYQKDQAKTIAMAMEYLKLRIENNKKAQTKKPLALVLDIDETSLSNYRDMITMSFGGTEEQIEQAEGKGTDAVIPATLELYRYAKANKVSVFFITGRTENYRDSTSKNLSAVGYADWSHLYLKPLDYKLPTAATYKTATRYEIEKQGYDIVLNIGDQASDLIGKHADKTFKLTNPYYIVP